MWDPLTILKLSRGNREVAASMAIRSLSGSLNRWAISSPSCERLTSFSVHPMAERLRNVLQCKAAAARGFASSNGSPIDATPAAKENTMQSTTTMVENWVGSGEKIADSKLQFIDRGRESFKSKRYNHDLEALARKESRKGFQMGATDCAKKLELLVKVQGTTEAEEYFDTLPNTASRKATCVPLLRGYVKEKNVEKAEAFMKKLSALGLLVNPHPFNEMLKLYMATFQYKKVPLVINEMKQNKIPRNGLSYSMWMAASAHISGAAEAERVYKEMLGDKEVKPGWSSLSTLANIYTKAGFVEKAVWALRKTERKLYTTKPLAYLFLITQYAALNKMDDVLRLWEDRKAIGVRIPCANYICILSRLVNLGDLVEAERIFAEWESNRRKYDVRVSNVLLGAYMRNGSVEKAEALHLRTLEKGGRPNYKTWEILTEGWMRSGNMVKATDAMKKALAMAKGCHWRPSENSLMAIVEYFEKNGRFEDANHYIREVHRLGLGSLGLYKSLLRIHVSAKKPAPEILEMMEKDRIEMDDETSDLVQSLN